MLFFSEKAVGSQEKEMEKFIEWFCDLPSYFTFPYYESEIKDFFLNELEITEKEISEIYKENCTYLEKLGFLVYINIMF